ncbi:MAG TPA: Rieske (2Fe-2S) protein [Pyrinomonadaceae bacterium]|nr:Rieske (2Fe-2S) protein [Pyrinomonadaceae bacterium]
MKDCNEIVDCSGRREFLVKSALIAGGLVLTVTGAAKASSLFSRFEDVVVPIDDKSPLKKVGGSAIVDSTAGKIIIVRTGDASFVAFSAVCTHKRGIVEYNAGDKRFTCPKHGSSFDGATGKVIDGPADQPLPSYPATGSATSVKVSVG